MMELVAFLLGALTVAGLTVPAILALWRDLKEAENRLLAAWKDGYAIPPVTQEEPKVEIPALPPDLQAHVDEWESPTVRAQVRDRILRLKARGMDHAAIAKTLFLDQERSHLT